MKESHPGCQAPGTKQAREDKETAYSSNHLSLSFSLGISVHAFSQSFLPYAAKPKLQTYLNQKLGSWKPGLGDNQNLIFRFCFFTVNFSEFRSSDGNKGRATFLQIGELKTAKNICSFTWSHTKRITLTHLSIPVQMFSERQFFCSCYHFGREKTKCSFCLSRPKHFSENEMR